MGTFYESETILSSYLLFHYGSAEESLPWPDGPEEALDFPVRCVSACLDFDSLPREAMALDLGCAVGRSSFELARHCSRVTGIDSSARFIEAARQLQERGALSYHCRTEGDLSVPLVAKVPDGIERTRVSFAQGDALTLPLDIGTFDVVLLANLIDRLPRPAALIGRLPSLVRPGGQLIIVSPYTWLEEFTPREHWLGGFQRDGKAVTTLDTLKDLLEPAFSLTARKNLPFLLREHLRKFQWSVAEATVWMKR